MLIEILECIGVNHLVEGVAGAVPFASVTAVTTAAVIDSVSECVVRIDGSGCDDDVFSIRSAQARCTIGFRCYSVTYSILFERSTNSPTRWTVGQQKRSAHFD